MPIKIPDNLPASEILVKENIFVMKERRALSQDIRALKILILNLMPNKIVTETQILRLLGNSPLQVDITLLHPETHRSKNTDPEYLSRFYYTFDQIRKDRFDGLIITGAPVEHLPFEEVDYWPELQEIMDWSLENVFSSFHICWGAQAALYHHYGIPKHQLKEKLFGIYPHYKTGCDSKLLWGFDDRFYVPHSRHTEVRAEDVEAIEELNILSRSPAAGVYIIKSHNERQLFITGHSEYDPLTLKEEYLRDQKRGLEIQPPDNYFPDDDPRQQPQVSWRGHAHLLFSNWLNYCVYQRTPYNLEELENCFHRDHSLPQPSRSLSSG